MGYGEEVERYEQVEFALSLVMPNSLLSIWIWNPEKKSQLTMRVGHQQTGS